MKQTQSFNTFQQRKDTFLRRGRFRWPYIKYSSYLAQPDTLASAGFVFSPAKDAPDNVQCFHCGFELTGWEPTDDPFAEHYAHEPNCTYAKLHCQVRIAVRGNKVELAGWPFESNSSLSPDERQKERQKVVDIRDDVQMRLDTFASGEWPHEGRAGWNVTPDKLAAAGFYYTPEFPRDDTATCAFCGYALGDWEADDEPIAEHSRRSADCLFFRLNDAPAADESAASLATPEEGAKRRSEAVHVVVSDSESESGVSDTSKRQRLSAANKGASHASPANGAEARGSPADKLEAHSSPSGRLETDGSLTDGVEAQGSSSGRLETYSSPTRGISSEKYADEISESDGSELEAERGAGAEEAAVSVMPPADKVSETQPTETQPTETQLTDTQVDTAPASPGNMVIDEIAHNEESTQQSAQIEAGNEWDMDSDEEEMTVEEFIRACCDQKIAALEASAGQMVDAFMKRAEGTRERICSLTW